MKTLMIVISPHHGNTSRIAKAMSKVLDADIVAPDAVRPDQLADYDLVGFGSDINSETHHPSLIALVAILPRVSGRKAFIFSTSAISEKSKVARDNERLRRHLQSKGYRIVGEFGCRGFNTNSFLKLLGGMNKGRLNEDDLRDAEDFARKLTGASPSDKTTSTDGRRNHERMPLHTAHKRSPSQVLRPPITPNTAP